MDRIGALVRSNPNMEIKDLQETVETQSVVSLEYIANSNNSRRSHQHHMCHIQLANYAAGLVEALRLYRIYIPYGNSPLSDSINTKTVEVQELLMNYPLIRVNDARSKS